MTDLSSSLILILGTGALVLLNGLFVAAEFGLVKVRRGRLQQMADDGRAFARSALWLYERLDRSLSACQLGITVASLGLGWIGEPAIARLLEPQLLRAGVSSQTVLHSLSFAIAFSTITAAHIVVGEQAPKIFAIREPEKMALWCAAPIRLFYVLSYPLLMALDSATSVLLRLAGVKGSSEHEAPHSAAEIRRLLSHSRAHGELTRSEHELLDAVLEFDDTVAREIIVPRVDVEFIDASWPLEDAIRHAKATRHTRYPVCEGSLDEVVGVLHIKDLTGISETDEVDLKSVMRPPRFVPETMPISRLLGHFQATRQHMAFVLDEYGSVTGIVTLENVLEQIVGAVEDEFDIEIPDVVPDGSSSYIVQGGTHLDMLNRRLSLDLHSGQVDTISGLLMVELGRVGAVGDKVSLDGVEAEILEVRDSRATRIRLRTTGAERTSTDSGGRPS